MSKFKIAIFSLIVIAIGSFSLINLSNEAALNSAENKVIDKSNAQNSLLTEQTSKKQPIINQEHYKEDLAATDRSNLPAEHGVADYDERQMNLSPQRMPPPPLPAPDSKYNNVANNSHNHGHDTTHADSANNSDGKPPPQGANK